MSKIALLHFIFDYKTGLLMEIFDEANFPIVSLFEITTVAGF